MNVLWTEPALADLRAIRTYIAAHSARYANSMVDRIFSSSELLHQHPLLGRVVAEFEDETIRELFENPYRIIYQTSEDRVDILAVVHAARRFPKSFREWQ